MSLDEFASAQGLQERQRLTQAGFLGRSRIVIGNSLVELRDVVSASHTQGAASFPLNPLKIIAAS